MKNSNRNLLVLLAVILILVVGYFTNWYGFGNKSSVENNSNIPLSNNDETQINTERIINNQNIYSKYINCVTHVFEDSYKKVTYALNIWAQNCKSPIVSDAIKFVDNYMNIHIQQGIINTPQQVKDELIARFNNKYPSLKLTVNIK